MGAEIQPVSCLPSLAPWLRDEPACRKGHIFVVVVISSFHQLLALLVGYRPTESNPNWTTNQSSINMVPWAGVHVLDEGFLTVSCFIIDPQVWVARGFKEAWKQSLREAKR